MARYVYSVSSSTCCLLENCLLSNKFRGFKDPPKKECSSTDFLENGVCKNLCGLSKMLISGIVIIK
jgi:hypothetical protein